MAAKKKSKAMDYIVSYLKKNPKVEYAAVKEGAAKKRLTIHPIMYGRAKLLLGLVKAGQGKTKKAKAAKRGPGRPRKTAKRGPGRPRKTSGRGPGRPRKTSGRRGRPRKVTGAFAAVQDLVSNLEGHVRENRELQETLVKVRDMIDRVL